MKIYHLFTKSNQYINYLTLMIYSNEIRVNKRLTKGPNHLIIDNIPLDSCVLRTFGKL